MLNPLLVLLLLLGLDLLLDSLPRKQPGLLVHLQNTRDLFLPLHPLAFQELVEPDLVVHFLVLVQFVLDGPDVVEVETGVVGQVHVDEDVVGLHGLSEVPSTLLVQLAVAQRHVEQVFVLPQTQGQVLHPTVVIPLAGQVVALQVDVSQVGVVHQHVPEFICRLGLQEVSLQLYFL